MDKTLANEILESLRSSESLIDKQTHLELNLGKAIELGNGRFLNEFLSDSAKCLKSLEDSLQESERSFPRAIRITQIPFCDAFHRNKVPSSADSGRFLCFTGTVVRVSSVKVYSRFVEFVCRKCNRIGRSESEWVCSGGSLMALNRNRHQICDRCRQSSGPPTKRRRRLSDSPEKTLGLNAASDYQELRVQEIKSSCEKTALIPKSLRVLLLGDLVDSCAPGDRLTIRGVLRAHKKTSDILELVLHANSLSLRSIDDDHFSVSYPLEVFARFWARHNWLLGRNQILKSFLPSLTGGLYYVRLGLALCLIGGSRRNSERSDSHLLLAGEAGTGKSEVLRFVKTLMPRCVLTSGSGSTSAGLTVAATRENSSDWHLEPGALVLADCGVCCIDDFSAIRAHERASVHEAMEQQVVSVAKAGLVCQVRSRCSVVATSSNSGADFESLAECLDIGTPLLSRFDLVLMLTDDENHPEWTQHLTNSLLSQHLNSRNDQTAIWPIQRLRAYVLAAKSREPAIITQKAQELINRYYCWRRKSVDRDCARTSVRLLEALVRLSHAHARLMMRPEVSVDDVVVVVDLIESTSKNSRLLARVESALKTDFPANPVERFREGATQILSGLGMSEDNM